jgi:hypothetical protein
MSKHHSLRRADHWEVSFWLVFDSAGGVRSVRGQPALERNERGMAMTVKVPHSLFSVPSLRATIDIQSVEPSVPPIDLTAAADALRGALGVDIDLRIHTQESEA